MIPLISSSSNKVYKKIQSLTTSKGIREHQLSIVSGEALCKEYLLRSSDHTNCFWVTTDREHPLCQKWILSQSLQLSRSLFNSVDICGVGSPLLIVPTSQLNEAPLAGPVVHNEIYCALGDPNNLGALIRSAVAFDIEKIVLLKEACNPFHPKTIKSSAGSVFIAPLTTGPSIHELESINSLYALDAGGTQLSQLPRGPKRFLLGEEGAGIPAQLDIQKISIAMDRRVESLNATVAASILFYELNKK